MKVQTVTTTEYIFHCEKCGNTSTDKEFILKCEASHKPKFKAGQVWESIADAKYRAFFFEKDGQLKYIHHNFNGKEYNLSAFPAGLYKLILDTKEKK